MKLLYCVECDDVVRLVRGKVRSCECGRASGKYLDNRYAVRRGGVPFGIHNQDFRSALSAQPEGDGPGPRFMAWVFAEDYQNFEELEDGTGWPKRAGEIGQEERFRRVRHRGRQPEGSDQERKEQIQFGSTGKQDVAAQES